MQVEVETGNKARETSNTMFITRFLLELANSYRANISYAGVNARKLLDEELAIYVLPCVNPDGYEMTQFSGSIKSNLPAKGIKNLSSAKSNANLVDLNRNFPNYSSAVLWKSFRKTKYYSSKPYIQFYAGKTLGDQPETQAVMRFVLKYLMIKSNHKRISQTAVICAETLPYGLSKPVDIAVQTKEWSKAKIPKAIMSTIAYNPS